MTQSPASSRALLPSLFFVVVLDALGDTDKALYVVVVIVVTTGAIVLPGIIEPATVLGAKLTVEYDVCTPTTTLGLARETAETVVVVGSKIISVVVVPGRVEGEIVDGRMVLPGKVVV